MKKLISIFTLLAVFAFVGGAWGAGGNNDPYFIDIRTLNTNSGATIQPDAGVSLIGTLKLAGPGELKKSRMIGVWSIQPGTVTFGRFAAGEGSGNNTENLNPGGTGLTGDSGATFEIRYAMSNDDLSTAQWQARAVQTGATVVAGTTKIAEWSVGGTGSGTSTFPVTFTPSPAIGQEIAFFFYSACSQFLVPTAKVAYQ